MHGHMDFSWQRDLASVDTDKAEPSGRAVQGVGLRPLACTVHAFESRRWHGCLYFVSVVFCPVQVSATDRSLVQRSPTDCMCVCVRARVCMRACACVRVRVCIVRARVCVCVCH